MTIRVLVADDQWMVRDGFRMLLKNADGIEIVAEVQLQALEGLAFQMQEAFQRQFDGVHKKDKLTCRRVFPEAHGIAQEQARVDVHLDRFGDLDSRVHC